jgi:hypothetical protein
VVIFWHGDACIFFASFFGTLGSIFQITHVFSPTTKLTNQALKNTVVSLEVTDTAVTRFGSVGASSPVLEGAIERLCPHPVRFRQVGGSFFVFSLFSFSFGFFFFFFFWVCPYSHVAFQLYSMKPKTSITCTTLLLILLLPVLVPPL